LQANRDTLARVLSEMACTKDNLDKGQEIFGGCNYWRLNDIFLSIKVMFGPRGTMESDHLKTVNEVVKGNLDVAEELLAAKPDKDLEGLAKKESERAEGKSEKMGK
jgi:hypothetical protein